MDMLVPAVIGDIVSRSASFAINKYWQLPDVEKNLERLNQLLLRAHTIIEEAEGRHISNQGMLQQLSMLIEGMYRCHYMLDTFKYRALQEETGDEEEVSPFSAVYKFNLAKRFRFSSSYAKTMLFGSNNIKELQGMISTLENAIADMKEFVIFLGNYPPMRRQPCCTYSVLENCMFGRQMERERLINFLLQTDDFGSEDLAVLPIIGPRKVGKSTLVEHVCRDDRVRNRYSSILFFRENNIKDEKVTNLKENSIVKHQNYASCERLLIIFELARDIDEETWIRLKSSVSFMTCRGKIIITSRSSKIANLGTTEALRLDFLHSEAYWYFFKMLAFGSTNPDAQPRLASIAMEIATEYRGSFLAAYIIGGLLRDNFNARFWFSARKYLRAYIHSQLRMFDEHPNNLLRKDQPVHCLRFAKASDHLWMSNYYETDSSQDQDPVITMSDIMLGCATPYGRFEALGWKSRVPPYYNYMISCVTKAPEHAVGRKKSSLRTALDLG